MPATYHFKPFPKPGEAHFEITSKESSLPTAQCDCPKDEPQCSKCRQIARDIPVMRSTSQAMLSPIKEHPDPVHSGLTPKQIRDRRRASSRPSIGAIFHSAVSSDDACTLFPNIQPREPRRSGSSSSTSSSRSRATLRHSSSSSSESSRSSSEQARSPLSSIPDVQVSAEDERRDS